MMLIKELYMKDLRLLGSTIRKISREKHIRIEDTLGCSANDAAAILDGRVFPEFSALQKLSEEFGIQVSDLLSGDEEEYNRNFVHCMGSFDDPQHREKILDIIDDYLVLLDAIN